jgi:hypothetical protein
MVDEQNLDPLGLEPIVTERWNALLAALDDRLQLGLLDKLSRVEKYVIVDDALVLTVPLNDDRIYLSKDNVLTQLTVTALDFFPVQVVRIQAPENSKE